MKIVFLDVKTMGEVPQLQNLNQLGDYVAYPLTFPHERLERIADAEVVITCKVLIDKELIDATPSLKLICVAATGTNNVDVEYAKLKGIQVKNVTGYSSESVAQLTVGMALSLVNQIAYYDKFVKSGQYASSNMFTHYGPSFFELKGKTLGILGLGNIGRRVAMLFEAFGMKIVYHSVSGKNLDGGYNHVSFKELLQQSDIVTIHCPLNSQTQNLIQAENIKLMKSSAILINMARGGIVNENDVVSALNQNVIAGFGTDVFVKEPMELSSSFLQVADPGKIILTPHIAWTSMEAREILVKRLIENILSFQTSIK